MIEEDYVSFETAKLLKEKGFDVPYDSFRGVYINGNFLRRNPGQGYLHNMDDEIIDVCSIQMAMKWLRKKYNLVISISITMDGWCSCVSRIKLDNEGFVVEIIHGIDEGNIPNYDTYEKACKGAIKYCLENLI